MNPSGAVFYYFADQLGTARVNVQDGTTPTLCYDADFYPYGGERNTPDPPYTDSCTQNYKFTGKERDASGNDYFGARYYASAIGRFLSPDWSAKVEPIPYAKLGNPQTLNLYSYVENNPLSGADPDGHACEGWLGDLKTAFCERAAEYGLVDQDVAIRSQTRFFAAAEAVSQAMADVRAVVAGFHVGEWFVPSQTADFLDSIGKDLEQTNAQLANDIRSGALSDPNLDARMVRTEQNEVQRLLDNLKASDPDKYNSIIGDVNTMLNNYRDIIAGKMVSTDRAYSDVLDKVRESLHGHIDFSRQADREAIGNAMIQHIEQGGGNDVNGSYMRMK